MIGTGIAGLGAAWLLNRRHQITVFEADERVGGHANTVSVDVDGRPTQVDTGFIVYNDVNYPNLIRLFEALDVPTEPSNMSFSVSVGGQFEYAGSLGGLVADPVNVVRPRMWRMLRDVMRFYKEAPRLLDDQDSSSISLGRYLLREGYSETFARDHLLPMGAAIWSCSPDDMLGFPAVSFVRFFVNHGLLKLKDRPQWRTVSGGSRNYVNRLIAPFVECFRTNCPVHAVERRADRVTVRFSGGAEDFDQVVIATHGDQALRLLGGEATTEERSTLGCFGYQSNNAVLHSDPALMPRRRGAWSSWNYLVGEDDAAPPAVTYWMNRLQNIQSAKPLFVSLNPAEMPSADLTYRMFVYDHPVFSADAISAQARLDGLQGKHRTWFCGSYHGYGFHEDAFASGCRVAAGLDAAPDWWAATSSGETGTMLAA